MRFFFHAPSKSSQSGRAKILMNFIEFHQSFFKRSKRFKRFKRFKRKNVDDEGNRKKYKNTEKQHENGKYDKWVVLIKPHNGCDAFRILIRNCK